MSRIAGSLLALALCAPAASAQPTDEAAERARFQRAVALFERGEHEAALAEFVALSARVQRPSVLYNLAATYEAMRRYPEAAETYARYLSVAPPDDPERRAALRAQQRVDARLGTLDLRCHPAGATVTVAGVTRPCPAVLVVATGEPHVVARWPDGRTAQVSALLASGERRVIELTADLPTRTDPPAPQEVEARMSSLRLFGLPPGATLRVDGALRAEAERQALRSGEHRLRVDAPGRVAWEEVLAVPPGPASLTLDLAPAPRGIGPAAFWATAGASAALLIGAAVTGALALTTHAEFSGLTRDDPRASDLSRRGDSLAASTDALLVGGVIGAVGAVVLGTQTHFSAPRSRATLRAEP